LGKRSIKNRGYKLESDIAEKSETSLEEIGSIRIEILEK
jgi:hypothetical protein